MTLLSMNMFGKTFVRLEDFYWRFAKPLNLKDAVKPSNFLKVIEAVKKPVWI